MTPDNPTQVVTAFVRRDGQVLLLRRSRSVGTYRGKWAAVSGFLEDVPPEDQARTELSEELGLGPSDVTLRAAGAPLPVDDPTEGRRWLVHPFAFDLCPGANIRLDWEHTEMRWVEPETIAELDTVPRLYEAWSRVRDVRADGSPDGGQPT